MIPKTWLYRHDEIVICRPYAVDVDDDGWLWEGCGFGGITGHHLRTARLRSIPIPEMGKHVAYQIFAWQGKLVIVLGLCPFYLVFDPATRRCLKVEAPATQAIVWYGTKTANNKLLLYERSESKVLILDAPDAKPRAISCPFPGQLASGAPQPDGLIYSSIPDPSRIIRFDPVAERFVDENPSPFTDAGLAGNFCHKGVIYYADSSGGRLVALEMKSGKWLDPIPAPDYKKLYGYIGGGFGFQGKGFFCLSNYAHRSRLDPKTGKIIMPEGPLTVDGSPSRFLDRFLVFDPERRAFDYLIAPEQPDGIPLLCYPWTDGRRFVITGIVIQCAKGEMPDTGAQIGPWLIMQSEDTVEEPGYGPYDFTWDRAAHLRAYRRSYSLRHSLYLPSPPHTPPIINVDGPATEYPPGKNAEIVRRAEKTDAAAYWKSISEPLCRDAETNTEKARAILRFAQHAIYYNPIQEPDLPRKRNPIAILESHDGRCGDTANIIQSLFQAAGIEARVVGLSHHVVAEACYDGGWHIADALFFGTNQPARDGRVLSVEELKADPYFADGYPQPGFVYDPELLISEDAFQVLGYVFGQWGVYEYYSYYLGGEKENPPTVPILVPPQREGEQRLRLRWAPAVKAGGGPIEYDVRIFGDRACRETIFHKQTRETDIGFDVPELHRMYYVEVRAMDDHRKKNPHTWYPAGRWNFVLVPPGTYGWYGTL